MQPRLRPLVLLALFLSLNSASALYWLRPRQSPSAATLSLGLASDFAGSTTSAIFPPPSAISTESALGIDSFFPDATVVGSAGPTPTGDEAEILGTAPAAPQVSAAFPLLNPNVFPANGTSANGDGGNSTTTVGAPNGFNVLRQWGNLSPMFSVPKDAFGEVTKDASALAPEGCEITQVHLVHRHGSRYPTSGSSPAQFAAKVHNATVNGTGFTATGPLAFLNTWTFKLGAELLTPFGREQLFDLGISTRLNYGQLLKNFTSLPVFRTTSEERMVQSAQNFAAGFFGIPEFLTDYHQLIIIESDGFNNTLAPFSICNNGNNGPAASLGSEASNAWVATSLPPTVARLQSFIQGQGADGEPGLNLTTSDVNAMQQLCAYETNALGFSSFCGLFTQEEFEDFEYFFDLDFWYGNGPGNPTTAAQGIGYVQELVSRLTQTPLDPLLANSTTNATLDANPVTFPLDQPIFVDATHDTVISSIIVALNFTTLAANGPLPLDHIPANQSYIVTHIAPFGATLTGQVLSCPSRTTSSSSASSSAATSPNGLFFRWLLNDGVVPQSGVSGCPADDPDGLCPLDTYIAAMAQRVSEVDFAFDCDANYTVPAVGSDGIVDGRPPVGERPVSLRK